MLRARAGAVLVLVTLLERDTLYEYDRLYRDFDSQIRHVLIRDVDP